MFTVLIAEKEYIDAIRQENKLFFEPFLESKELAFCYWNPNGQNLYDSVPGLMDAVGRTKNWRAVIINNCTAERIKSRNPFDVVDSSPITSLNVPNSQLVEGESWDEWEADWKNYYDELTNAKEAVYRSALENPLQKLSTWLCFRPEDYILNEVEEKQGIHDWAISEIKGININPSDRLENLERKQYKKEIRMKENIRREFVSNEYLNIAYPKEVHCISVRTSDNRFFDPDTYWNLRKESDYSSFADRNMYFDKMRFMVFDLLPRTHRDFRTDYIRFLASILVFISNQVPASSMQARRLYELETKTDDTPLCTLVTSYDKKLAVTAEVIENEMDKIRGEIPGELTDKDAEALFCSPKDVVVVLDDSCDPEKVFAEKDYGLFYDSPENEFYKWNRNCRSSNEALAYISKQRIRSVKKSVNQMHLSGEITDINVSRLTPLQIEDVTAYANNSENEMVQSIPPDLADVSRYTKRLSEESDKVKKVISKRMSKKTTIILSSICLGIYLLCFLPFLLNNNSTPKTVTASVIFTAIVIGIFAFILVLTLYFLRAPLLRAVRGYNNAAHEIMADINSAMNKFSKYLSASANVRRGHAIKNCANKDTDEYTKSLHIRKKHLEDIRKKRAYLAEGYGDYFGDRSYCDETMSRPYDYDFDQRVEYEYPTPFLAGDARQIEFISSGNFVTVPSSYITSITVRMEEIYDK